MFAKLKITFVIQEEAFLSRLSCPLEVQCRRDKPNKRGLEGVSHRYRSLPIESDSVSTEKSQKSQVSNAVLLAGRGEFETDNLREIIHEMSKLVNGNSSHKLFVEGHRRVKTEQ